MTSHDGAVIARFEIRRRAYLGPGGDVLSALPGFAVQSALIPLYQAITLTRAFDVKAVALQRTGRLGTYAVSLGQEAVSVGVASAMDAPPTAMLVPGSALKAEELKPFTTGVVVGPKTVYDPEISADV